MTSLFVLITIGNMISYGSIIAGIIVMLFGIIWLTRFTLKQIASDVIELYWQWQDYQLKMATNRVALEIKGLAARDRIRLNRQLIQNGLPTELAIAQAAGKFDVML